MILLEPLSIKNTKYNLSVSLRGSLAGQYYELLSSRDKIACSDYVQELLFSEDPDLIKYQEEWVIVIGRNSERGRFFPDW